ncbi:hypothetical protein LMG11582_6008 [Bifidobacterium bifidum]|nr:hypothetical protein LMG11582_6008 [Bifidobacterium bifidum]
MSFLFRHRDPGSRACLPLRAAAHHVRRQGRADRRARQRPSDVQGRALLGGQGPMRHAVRHDPP